MYWIALFAVLSAPLLAGLSVQPLQPASPRAAVEELLEADRAYAGGAAKTDAITALSAMFADDVVMAAPGGRFAEGRTQAVEVLRSNPDNAQARLDWSPERGGISADAHHGFTFGYMTIKLPDGRSSEAKYLAYWIKGRGGWRVAVYKRTPRQAGEGTPSRMTHAFPEQIVAVSTDAASVERHRESLAEAERAFSRDAQSIGLGPAFARYGAPDAVNMGGRNDRDFVVGPEAIARLVSAGEPATGASVAWGPDRVIVASSGDLGVTIGMIRPHKPQPGGPEAFPFFTIWRRASPAHPWRYVAE